MWPDSRRQIVTKNKDNTENGGEGSFVRCERNPEERAKTEETTTKAGEEVQVHKGDVETFGATGGCIGRRRANAGFCQP